MVFRYFMMTDRCSYSIQLLERTSFYSKLELKTYAENPRYQLQKTPKKLEIVNCALPIVTLRNERKKIV